MGSSVRSVLLIVAALEFGCSALEDLADEFDMTQREVTFDVAEILGRKGSSQLEPDITQKEVTFEGLWEPIDLPEADPDLTQREVTLDLLKTLRERGSIRGEHDMTQRIRDPVLDGHFEEMGTVDRPMLSPRSFKPMLPFPPARPDAHNFPAICRHGEGRPRYPPSSLPQTGFSHLHRQGDAINHVESLFSFCCQKNGTLGAVLSFCCAQHAWEHALNNFCKEEFSIKTRHYHCCKKQGGARWSCFEKEAPNKTYQPTDKSHQPTGEESAAPRSASVPGFTWNPDTCPRFVSRSNVQPRASNAMLGAEPKVPEIRFPPGRPTASNIGMVCDLRKLRPRYSLKCLPSNSYGWLERQSKAINRMEKGIKQCCKGKEEVLACADAKWLAVMNRYCKEEHSVKNRAFACCDLSKGPDRDDCFSKRAPNPEYRHEMLQEESQDGSVTLRELCETHKLVTKRFPVPLPVKSLVRQCCHLPAAQRTACLQGELVDLMEKMCAGKEPQPPTVSPGCCSQALPQEANCLATLLREAVIKANRFTKIKKKCPLV